MSRLKNIPIVHATTVHPWWDNRVSNKMVSGLAKAGCRVYFIVNSYPVEKRPDIDQLSIKTLNVAETGLKGRLVKNIAAYKKALAIKDKGIFHFHDPELIFVAALMRLRGWRVVYDVHEDYFLDIAHKPYLGKFARTLLPYIFRFVEQSFIRLFGFHLVNAEKVYKVRYPKGTEILNYPLSANSRNDNSREDFETINLIYTGVMQKGRGAFKLRQLLQADPRVHITIVGRCPDSLKQEILDDCSDYSDRLTMQTTPEGIAFDEIVKAYQQGHWAAGISVFSHIPNFVNTEPTKFFEYIQYSLPILASSFPKWQEFVEGQGIGLCIDPDDIAGSFPRALEALKDRGEWNTLKSNCQHVSGKYSWDSQQDELINLYKTIISK